jgi:hypothetical protein
MTMPLSTRFYLYRVAASVLPILVLAGVLTMEMSEHVLALLLALFGVAESVAVTAAVNTQKTVRPPDE